MKKIKIYDRHFMIFLLSLSMLLIFIIYAIFHSVTVDDNDNDNDNSNNNSDNIDIDYIMEYAYFEGQRDAINNDIRIEYDSLSNKYLWLKSPWDNSSKKIKFIPDESNN